MSSTAVSRARGAFIVLAIAALVGLFADGCHKHRDCVETIKQRIPVGSSLETATTALMECGLKIQLDTQKRTVYGDKSDDEVPVKKRTQVLIQLDANDRVVSVDASAGLTGP